MKAFIRFIRLERRVQDTRLDAPRFRFLICQTRGGMSRIIVVRANVGTATAAGVNGKLDFAMVGTV